LFPDLDLSERVVIGWDEALSGGDSDQSDIVHAYGDKLSYTHTWHEPSIVEWIATKDHTDAYSSHRLHEEEAHGWKGCGRGTSPWARSFHYQSTASLKAEEGV
jgi:hypothetical protein